ncbi:MAG TPA: class III extradiol ring-cleavage dioxygenase [Magnetospirillaceae bacterium]|nr:class III extradiol ring-cleavage dioxygenase [Magnetospirillaceae bacterium]
MQSPRARALYIPHGGGPLPLLDDPGHTELVEALRGLGRGLGRELGRPSAILIISAHWEEPEVRVTTRATPKLLYDYYGFPREAYEIRYPAPGDSALSGRVLESLTAAGIPARSEDTRGFDHGVFVPLALMYPEADIPCVQVSLVRGLDPRAHLELGRALSALAGENLLVLGSGFSFNNMREFFTPAYGEFDPRNESFQAWLVETCVSPNLPDEERGKRLENWERAPHARYCHPREEHFLPLHVCAGFAARPASRFWSWTVLGKRASAFLWEPGA